VENVDTGLKDFKMYRIINFVIKIMCGQEWKNVRTGLKDFKMGKIIYLQTGMELNRFLLND
jgi:hypothetical protein